MTILFGVYSLYNILDYLNNIERIYNYKLLDLQSKLIETDKHYNNLYFDFIKIKNEVGFLSDKIVIIEKKLAERPLYCFSPNVDYYESSEDDKKSNETKNTIRITSENNNLKPNNVLLNENVNKNIDENIDETVNKITEYDCVEIENIADINTIKVSDCSSRKNSLTNSNLENDSFRKGRSTSISDVNWSGLMKTFLLG